MLLQESRSRIHRYYNLTIREILLTALHSFLLIPVISHPSFLSDHFSPIISHLTYLAYHFITPLHLVTPGIKVQDPQQLRSNALGTKEDEDKKAKEGKVIVVELYKMPKKIRFLSFIYSFIYFIVNNHNTFASYIYNIYFLTNISFLFDKRDIFGNVTGVYGLHLKAAEVREMLVSYMKEHLEGKGTEKEGVESGAGGAGGAGGVRGEVGAGGDDSEREIVRETGAGRARVDRSCVVVSPSDPLYSMALACDKKEPSGSKGTSINNIINYNVNNNNNNSNDIKNNINNYNNCYHNISNNNNSNTNNNNHIINSYNNNSSYYCSSS